jgi:hypothetical protein
MYRKKNNCSVLLPGVSLTEYPQMSETLTKRPRPLLAGKQRPGHCLEGTDSALSICWLSEATQAEVDAAWQMIKDIFPHGHENSPVMGASLHIVSETYSVCLMGLSTLILLLYMISSMTSSPFAIEMGCVFSPADFSVLVPR